MADRLVIDLTPTGQVSVSTWFDGEVPNPVGPPLEFAWPLDPQDLEDLRWYLEDYLRAPFGVYKERGPRIEAKIPAWGETLFKAVFGAGPARDVYVRLRAGQRPGTGIVVRSEASTMLGLPWELLRDPDRPVPLALDLAGLTRSLPAAALPEAFAPGETLRVLMVIARPGGPLDVGYRMVARPLLQRLEAVRGKVELVVLRPPTLAALDAALAEAVREGRPFQIVHFDGHGVMAGARVPVVPAGLPLTLREGDREGVVVFEKAGGGKDPVSASRFAQVLSAGQVPLVMLNACQSGAVGEQVEAAVATRLLQGGASSVVAMGYSVYAVAAAEFMAALYERLFAGDGVTEAVTAGRRRLFQANERPSLKGKLPLQDWMVPVHYLRREVRFPDLRPEPGGREVSLDQVLDDLRESPESGTGGGLDPVGEFVGRDAAFYELERAVRLQRVVVVHGSGGTGKTELAKAFGRWWRDTAGVERPEWVLFHSFEPGVASFGLDGVVAEIGLQVFGADFARLDHKQRRAAVLKVLREHRLLLIWDNFESVHTMPDPAGATPPLDNRALDDLKAFVRAVAASGGQSGLIVTSRTEEPWLGDVRHLPLGGLTRDEAIEYTDMLLEPYPSAASRRAQRTFGELLDWLDGHPLAMRLMLPHLADTEPEALVSALRGEGELPHPSGDDQDRRDSLSACIDYSFRHLRPSVVQLLPAVSLFQGVADASVLAVFSQVEMVPARFRSAGEEDWLSTLDDAAGVGLLTPVGDGMYRIHPALPVFLTFRWQSEAGGDYVYEHAAATDALLIAHARLGVRLWKQITSPDAAHVLRVLDRERGTLGHLFGHALASGRWVEAWDIAEPLMEYCLARGLAQVAQGWVDRACLAIEAPDGALASPGIPSGLWCFLVGTEARLALRQGLYDRAERSYRRILALLERQPGPTQRRGLATTYFMLGRVAEGRGHPDDAEDWYRKSLGIEEELGNRPGMATTYHQLGSVAQDRGHVDEAEGWYRRSLEIKEELGNRPEVAFTYHQLGNVAIERGRLDEAEGWYRRSLEIKAELGNRPGMATTYQQLGSVAQGRGHLDDAEDWYRTSLEINEEFGNRPGMASVYHQLGSVAQDRGHLDEAEDWYHTSLEIREELADRPGMATTYHQLGMVAQLRGHLDDAEDWYRRSLEINEELDSLPGMASTYRQLGVLAEGSVRLQDAVEWMVRCVTLFEEFPHPATGPGPWHLARLARLAGVDVLERCWQRVTGGPVPQSVWDVLRQIGDAG